MAKNGSTNVTIPSGIPTLISNIAKEQTKFIWTIEDVHEIRKNAAWEAVNCEVTVGTRSFILSLTTKDGKLYIKPTVLDTGVKYEKNIVYAIQLEILNDKNVPVYTPMIGKEKFASASTNGGNVQKWEVLKFGECNFDYFSSMVFNGSLKLLVEVTVFKDTQTA